SRSHPFDGASLRFRPEAGDRAAGYRSEHQAGATVAQSYGRHDILPARKSRPPICRDTSNVGAAESMRMDRRLLDFIGISYDHFRKSGRFAAVTKNNGEDVAHCRVAGAPAWYTRTAACTAKSHTTSADASCVASSRPAPCFPMKPNSAPA